MTVAFGPAERVRSSDGPISVLVATMFADCVAPGKWLARCGDRASGPQSLSEAKANAFAMAKGADGDYRIENPVTHLNGLQALLVDREAS